MKRLSLVLLLAAFLAGGWLYPEAQAGPPSGRENQLKEIRKKIRKEEEVLKQIAGKKKSLFGALEELDQAISLAREELRISKEQIRKLEEEARKLKQELDSIEKQLEARGQSFEQRLVAYYRLGRTGALPVLFSEGSFGEKMQSLDSMKRILASDWDVIRSFQSLVREKESKASSLQENLEREKALQQSIQERQKELLARKKEKDALLSKLERDKKLHEKALQESRQAGDELERWIRSRQEEERKRQDRKRQETRLARKFPEKMKSPDFAVPAGDSFLACKGKLPWPVKGELFRGFGKQYDPKVRSDVISKGIDIRTVPETPVRAIWAGQVVYADWFRGYGKLMIVDHGEKSYSVLSYLSRLVKNEGDRVEAGETVGYAGDTGSLHGCMVHLEIWYKGEAQDPLDWIRIR